MITNNSPFQYIISTPNKIGKSFIEELWQDIVADKINELNKANNMSTLNRRITAAPVNKITSQTSVTANRGRFIIGSVDAMGNFSVSNNPVVHTDSVTARAECSRLSKLNPGKTFVFLQISGGEFVPAGTTSF